MKPLAWMVGASVSSWLAIAAWSGMSNSREVLFGMLAPLAGAAATWVLVARAFPSRPEAGSRQWRLECGLALTVAGAATAWRLRESPGAASPDFPVRTRRDRSMRAGQVNRVS